MKRFDYTSPVYKSEYESFPETDCYRQQMVVEILRRSPAVYDSDIEVLLKNNNIYIVGSVPNLEVRQAAERAIQDCLPWVHLVNELTVTSQQQVYF